MRVCAKDTNKHPTTRPCNLCRVQFSEGYHFVGRCLTGKFMKYRLSNEPLVTALVLEKKVPSPSNLDLGGMDWGDAPDRSLCGRVWAWIKECWGEGVPVN